ncbi:MAG: hypothetical protein PHR06_15420, partial [Candidatus Cloacimonetes bacterium]|nr:hypothetical protein [Candidatus Cloacimonadota bacterium]
MVDGKKPKPEAIPEPVKEKDPVHYPEISKDAINEPNYSNPYQYPTIPVDDNTCINNLKKRPDEKNEDYLLRLLYNYRNNNEITNRFLEYQDPSGELLSKIQEMDNDPQFDEEGLIQRQLKSMKYPIVGEDEQTALKNIHQQPSEEQCKNQFNEYIQQKKKVDPEEGERIIQEWNDYIKTHPTYNKSLQSLLADFITTQQVQDLLYWVQPESEEEYFNRLVCNYQAQPSEMVNLLNKAGLSELTAKLKKLYILDQYQPSGLWNELSSQHRYPTFKVSTDTALQNLNRLGSGKETEQEKDWYFRLYDNYEKDNPVLKKFLLDHKYGKTIKSRLEAMRSEFSGFEKMNRIKSSSYFHSFVEEGTLLADEESDSNLFNELKKREDESDEEWIRRRCAQQPGESWLDYIDRFRELLSESVTTTFVVREWLEDHEDISKLLPKLGEDKVPYLKRIQKESTPVYADDYEHGSNPLAEKAAGICREMGELMPQSDISMGSKGSDLKKRAYESLERYRLRLIRSLKLYRNQVEPVIQNLCDSESVGSDLRNIYEEVLSLGEKEIQSKASDLTSLEGEDESQWKDRINQSIQNKGVGDIFLKKTLVLDSPSQKKVNDNIRIYIKRIFNDYVKYNREESDEFWYLFNKRLKREIPGSVAWSADRRQSARHTREQYYWEDDAQYIQRMTAINVDRWVAVLKPLMRREFSKEDFDKIITSNEDRAKFEDVGGAQTAYQEKIDSWVARLEVLAKQNYPVASDLLGSIKRTDEYGKYLKRQSQQKGEVDHWIEDTSEKVIKGSEWKELNPESKIDDNADIKMSEADYEFYKWKSTKPQINSTSDLNGFARSLYPFIIKGSKKACDLLTSTLLEKLPSMLGKNYNADGVYFDEICSEAIIKFLRNFNRFNELNSNHQKNKDINQGELNRGFAWNSENDLVAILDAYIRNEFFSRLEGKGQALLAKKGHTSIDDG